MARYAAGFMGTRPCILIISDPSMSAPIESVLARMAELVHAQETAAHSRRIAELRHHHPASRLRGELGDESYVRNDAEADAVQDEQRPLHRTGTLLLLLLLLLLVVVVAVVVPTGTLTRCA